MQKLIDKLEKTHTLTKDEFTQLLKGRTMELSEYLFKRSAAASRRVFSNKVYIRGLIEFTNYCKNNCYYCGIRAANSCVQRYRLTDDEIMECCRTGYSLGFRTFVLQGGEDPGFSPDRLCCTVENIKKKYPDCAVTLSVGEHERGIYQSFYDAGADRYLLRHETYDEGHYKRLHPAMLSAEHRKKCLYYLKEIGFQTGTGFMVGSPWQTAENLASDFKFIEELQPEMVGIGPFIPHKDTPFRDMKSGTLEETLFCIGLLRLMLPKALIPATTALGTIHPHGRELGLKAGANVVMPNLSPKQVRKKYTLYNDKICMDEEAAEGLDALRDCLDKAGFQIYVGRGDFGEQHG